MDELDQGWAGHQNEQCVASVSASILASLLASNRRHNEE
jgi:hypothetical protein